MDHEDNYDENNNNIENGEEEFENDIYLIELHKRLTQMKKERQKAETDAQLLDNRLRLLKGEEQKTWKKIEVTRKKTQEKMVTIQKQEENYLQKMLLKESREKDLELKKEINIKLKTDIKEGIEQKRQQKMDQIMEEAKRLREQKKNNEELLKYIKNEEQANNKTKCEYIKSQQMLHDEKKRAKELERKNQMKMDLERKILDELRVKEEAESKLQNLEQEEIEVMKRIRTTTQVHKAMVEDLEKLNINDVKAENTSPIIRKKTNGSVSSGKKSQ